MVYVAIGKIANGFYLTYEELKPVYNEADRRNPEKGFYLTYEELKPIYKKRQLPPRITFLSYL